VVTRETVSFSFLFFLLWFATLKFAGSDSTPITSPFLFSSALPDHGLDPSSPPSPRVELAC